MFGWGLSSQINNPQSYSKQRVTAGEKLDHLISISPPPQGHATSPAEGWDGKQQQGSGWEAAVLGPEVTCGSPHLAGCVGLESCQLTPSLGSILTRGTQILGLRARRGP